MSRTIGPVTGATAATAATVNIVCWIASLFGLTVPADVQGWLTVVAVFAAGWLVSPEHALARARAELHKDTNDTYEQPRADAS